MVPLDMVRKLGEKGVDMNKSLYERNDALSWVKIQNESLFLSFLIELGASDVDSSWNWSFSLDATVVYDIAFHL